MVGQAGHRRVGHAHAHEGRGDFGLEPSHVTHGDKQRDDHGEEAEQMGGRCGCGEGSDQADEAQRRLLSFVPFH